MTCRATGPRSDPLTSTCWRSPPRQPLPQRGSPSHSTEMDTRETKPANSSVDIVKPTLEGTISAYHSHEGSDGVIEAQRLEEAGLGSRETLRHAASRSTLGRPGNDPRLVSFVGSEESPVESCR